MPRVSFFEPLISQKRRRLGLFVSLFEQLIQLHWIIRKLGVHIKFWWKIIPCHEHRIRNTRLYAQPVREREIGRLKVERSPANSRRVKSDYKRTEAICLGTLEKGKRYFVRARPLGLLVPSLQHGGKRLTNIADTIGYRLRSLWPPPLYSGSLLCS